MVKMLQFFRIFCPQKIERFLQFLYQLSIIYFKLRENLIGTSCSNAEYGHKRGENEQFFKPLTGHKWPRKVTIFGKVKEKE